MVYKSKYKIPTLDSLYRKKGYVQFQQFVLSYTFIKYNRKVSNIPYNYIDIKKISKSSFNYSLFCINKGSFHYSYLDLYKAKITMEYLFPFPTPYEIIDYSLSNLSFKAVNFTEKKKKIDNKKIKKINKQLEESANHLSHKHLKEYYFFISVLLFIIFAFFIKIYLKYYHN